MKFSALHFTALCGLLAITAQPVISKTEFVGKPSSHAGARLAVESAKRNLRTEARATYDDESFKTPDEGSPEGSSVDWSDEGVATKHGGQWPEGTDNGVFEPHNEDWSEGMDGGLAGDHNDEGPDGMGVDEGVAGGEEEHWSTDMDEGVGEGEDDHGPEGMEEEAHDASNDDASEPMQDEGNY